jgi:hypothetical protein
MSSTVALCISFFHSDMQVLKSQLYVEKYVESNRHTFLDYISVGCQLNFMVGVDFTGMQQTW